MNRHVGASFTLSFSIVGFFAVILYQPEGSPARPMPLPPVVRHVATEPVAPQTLADSSPVTIPSGEARGTTDPREADPTVTRAGKTGTVGPEMAARTPDRTVFAASSKPRPATRGRVPRRPSSDFTEVGAGESLADVATRVYGSPEAARTLWRANRDLIGSREPRVEVGMLLRTP